jgi:hypothetical protein
MMNTASTTRDRTAVCPGQHTTCDEQTAPLPGGEPAGHSRLVTWLTGKVRSAGDRMFCAEDTRAIANGWQITRGKLGLSRTYRDPRFDALAACDQCDGSGETADQPCARCAGTGRITLETRKGSPREQRRVP